MDYRKEAGKIVDLNKTKAKSEWEQAKKEIGKNQVEMTLTLNDKLMQAIDYDYDMCCRTWQPRYVDPMAFAINGGIEHLKDDYDNPNYWNNLEKVLVTNTNEFSKRRGFIIAAEKDLVGKDAFVAPLFQQGNGYLLNPNLRCVGFVPYGSACILRDAWIKK